MSELIKEGVNLMAMGMGTVFVFLTVLVVGTSLMSFVVSRLPGGHEPEPVANRRPAGEDLAEVAAVAAAAKMIHER